MITTSTCHIEANQNIVKEVSISTISGDKSISHRAIILSSLSSSTVTWHRFLISEDCLNTLEIFQQLGVHIERQQTTVTIYGVGLYGLTASKSVLDVGNSGTGIRLITGVLAGQKFTSQITGDKSIQKRPMKRITKPLELMGATINGHTINKSDDIFPPLTIHGHQLRGIHYEMPMASAQVKSAILLAGLFAKTSTTVVEPSPCRDHTERLYQLFKIPLTKEKNQLTITPVSSFKITKSDPITIPADFSSAMFFIVLGLIKKESVFQLTTIGLNPTRRGALDVLHRMGATIQITQQTDTTESYGTIKVTHSILKSVSILEKEIPNIIDEIPILAIAGLLTEGDFTIRHAKELRVKESDRIQGIVKLIRAIGGNIEEYNDGFVIHGPLKNPVPFEFDSKKDHRLAMSAIIAAIGFNVTANVKGYESISTSFPNFFEILKKSLNIQIQFK